MKPKKLEQKVVDLILPRLSNEMDAFYFYRSASNYLADAGYKYAAKYFAEESDDELTHAKGLEKYLTDWNVVPMLPLIDRPEMKFSGLIDVIEKAYNIEYELYELYEETAKKMFVADLCTFSLMQDYLNIQLKSIAEYSDFLNQIALIDANDKLSVLMLEERLFKK